MDPNPVLYDASERGGGSARDRLYSNVLFLRRYGSERDCPRSICTTWPGQPEADLSWTTSSKVKEHLPLSEQRDIYIEEIELSRNTLQHQKRTMLCFCWRKAMVFLVHWSAKRLVPGHSTLSPKTTFDLHVLSRCLERHAWITWLVS